MGHRQILTQKRELKTGFKFNYILLLPLYSHFSNLFDYAYVIAVFNNYNTEFATPIKVFAYKDNVDVR